MKAENELDGQRINTLAFLSHSNKSTDRYSEYLSKDPEPSDAASNPRNFFDDSNRVDKKWLKIAKDYLGRLK